MRTFPKVAHASAPGLVKLKDLSPGELVVDGEALEYRSQRGDAIRMDPVRGVAIDSTSALITITHGRGATIASDGFVDLSRGFLHARGASRALVSELQQVFASAAPPDAEEDMNVQTNAATQFSAALAPVGTRGRNTKWIFGILTLVAAAGALLTISAGAFGGTSFFIVLFVFSFAWYRYGLRSERNARKAASSAESANAQKGQDSA